ncbi:MAG: hydrogenase subunit MbhD domain-containing protein [Candidatus Diapherotrites archaeon]
MILESVSLAMIVLSAALVAKTKDLLFSTAFLAIMSVLLALQYYLLQAPDVAITEASVGACLGTAFFIIAIMLTSRVEK